MRSWLLLLGLLGWSDAVLAGTAPAKVLKVIPLYLDEEGRHALSPSLYERDAYQATLAKHPEQRAGVRYAIHWKLPKTESKSHVLRLELRGAKTHSTEALVLEMPAKPTSTFGRWTRFDLKGIDYHDLGAVIAWRASIYTGQECLAEQKSFLW
jgi:hypothetical protein